MFCISPPKKTKEKYHEKSPYHPFNVYRFVLLPHGSNRQFRSPTKVSASIHMITQEFGYAANMSFLNLRFDWNQVTIHQRAVQEYLKLLRRYPLVDDLKDFKTLEDQELRNYFYKDTQHVIHPDIQAYKEELVDKVLSNYTALLESTAPSLWTMPKVRKAFCCMVDGLMAIYDLAFNLNIYYQSGKSEILGINRK